MNRKPSFNLHLSRLENGKLSQPSLRLVADYLRACRASFNDILVPLAQYTSLPPLREKPDREVALAGLAGDHSRDASRLEVYDRKTEAARKRAGQKPVAPAKRAAALSRQLRSAQDQRRLARMVEGEVNRLGIAPTLTVRKLALDYGRMVWRALKQTEAEQRLNHRDTETDRELHGQGTERTAGMGTRRETRGFRQPAKPGRGRPRKTRAERLRDAEARAKALGPGVLTGKAYRQLRAAVERLYELTHPRRPRQN
ncbi:MAG TPA: hypothetical protein ENN51_05130 [candidate division WOR-3 bacterium]|uniref:Uncharacterized protein n=1 Tax=candidate division WOR-3 bacterium TaxID=2052148 RepID=A0A7V0XF19_UNCW3|nr:hypothetical protein [candidate division WOR-3 bacterium]